LKIYAKVKEINMEREVLVKRRVGMKTKRDIVKG